MERIWIFMKITEDIIYAGVNDHQVDLFEGQYKVPNGMAYNSYVILDEKTAVMDTVDANFKDEWLENVAKVLDGAKPDYLVVQHMEPDHAANIENFMKAYPDTTVVANTKTFTMMGNFFRNLNLDGKKLVVANGDSLTLGKHVLTFVFAPMVHWPEVMVTYDSTDKVLFSADGFGKFGALDVEEDWDCEARRYYIGIVGKYGAQVQKLLKAAATLDIQTICPLHGPILTENLGHYLEKYDIWSSYKVESEGVVIAYTSVYGNTKKAVELLAQKLEENKFDMNDLLDQLRQIQKMGSLKSIIGMLPGVGDKMKDVDLDDRQFVRIEAMITSMTKAERAKPSIINPSRKRRIAAGSGTKVEEINRLLKQFEQMQKMMKQFGSKNGKLGRRARKQLAGMNLEQLQNSIPGNIPGVPPGLMPKK